MNDFMCGFKRFLLEGAQATQMHDEYKQVLKATDLTKTRQVKDVIKDYKGFWGIYFWLMRLDSAEYIIYIGATNSLSRRVNEYTSEFQPHSTNDYKLRIFHTFMTELDPRATLDLYFSDKMPELLLLPEKEKKAELVSAENKAVATYGPLLYGLPELSPQAKDELKQVFSRYYRSAFEQKLRSDA